MFGAESRNSVDKTGPSRSSVVRAAVGRAAAGLVVTVDENAGGEIATLRSLMGAPPHTGLEQRLRRKHPEGPGGCVKSPIALYFAKLALISCRQTQLQWIISNAWIRKSHKLKIGVIRRTIGSAFVRVKCPISVWSWAD
jgi:hypothetical protein